MLGQIGKHSDHKTKKSWKSRKPPGALAAGQPASLFLLFLSCGLNTCHADNMVAGSRQMWTKNVCKLQLKFCFHIELLLQKPIWPSIFLWVFCRYPHSPGSHQSSQCKSSLIVSNITSRDICHNLNSYSRLEAGDWKKTFSFLYWKLK